jgi:HD-GYP domain-containing protein (c-di-GMP phosphodiesterase class II)
MTHNTQAPEAPGFNLLTGSLVLVLGAALYATYAVNPLTTQFILGLCAFLFLAVLSESYPLNVPMGNAAIGMSGTIYWALIVLFEPFWAAGVGFLGFLISDLIVRRKTPRKAVFNSAQVGLSSLLASIAFVGIKGTPGLAVDPSFFLAFAAAVLVYWLTNTWLVSIGAWALYGEAPHRFWQHNFQWAFIYELTSAPIALAVAVAYQELWLMGLLLLALPILMIRMAYSQYLELKRTYRETVRTLVKIIEMHDPYTAGHSDRVAIYSRRLCESLGLSTKETERIELAAYLHDLGKIHLELSGIVRKEGKLTEEERRLVRLHSVVSADLAVQVSHFRGEIEGMIRHHHENWDGSGYPHGLKGDQIPLGARIILLADAFDAMTTSRVYRNALDLAHVKDEFRKFAGSQFDPNLTPVFLESVIGDGSTLIRQPVDEPLEGQRAREQLRKPDVVPFRRGVFG